MIDCHVRDGAALSSYLAWLENELVVNNNESLNEYTAALVLDGKRFE